MLIPKSTVFFLSNNLLMFNCSFLTYVELALTSLWFDKHRFCQTSSTEPIVSLCSSYSQAIAGQNLHPNLPGNLWVREMKLYPPELTRLIYMNCSSFPSYIVWELKTAYLNKKLLESFWSWSTKSILIVCITLQQVEATFILFPVPLKSLWHVLVFFNSYWPFLIAMGLEPWLLIFTAWATLPKYFSFFSYHILQMRDIPCLLARLSVAKRQNVKQGCPDLLLLLGKHIQL